MSIRPLLLLAVAAALVGCVWQDDPAPEIAAPTVKLPDLDPETDDIQGVRRAMVDIEPIGGSSVAGTVTFERVESGGVRVRALVTGLSDDGYHAFQVLRGRDCSSDPTIHLGVDEATPHGGPYSLPGLRHLGDLGNIRGDDGDGRYDRIDAVLPLDGTMSVVGRAVVIRERRDDGVNPGGNAGGVIGCGIAEAR